MAKTKATNKNKNKKHDTAPDAKPAPKNSISTLSDLREDRDLWYKICVLVYDLRHIKDKISENRTLQTTDPLYISGPYFSPEEAASVKGALVDGGEGREDNKLPIEQAITTSLENFFEKRRASGDSRPCGPHDMVPVYLECFGIGKEEIEDERFISRVRREGVGRK